MPFFEANSIPESELQQHEHFMSIALDLALKGQFSCTPNPMVGAVIVRDGKIIGQGHHHTAGCAHAEVNAIADALKTSSDVKMADLYVTLEPCSHTGRTPPCCDAIWAHEFNRIIIACKDQNPLVSGEGISRLSKKYEVIVNVLEQQALDLNHSFFHGIRHKKPWVQLKIGASLDGKIALENGQSQWITGPESRQDVHRLRLGCDAVITGKGTLIHDNARLDARESMLGFSPERQPLRVILDRTYATKETLEKQHKERASQQTLVVLEDTTPVPESAPPHISFTHAPSQNDLIELRHLLTLLYKKGINRALVEAGPTLAGEFLTHQLVDEIVLYLAPMFLGHQAKSLFTLPLLEKLPNQRQWYFHDVRLVGEDQQDLKVVLRKKPPVR